MCSVSEEELCEEFDEFGVNLDDRVLIEKLQELCMVYRLDAGKMATEWIAFQMSHKLNNLTVDCLEPFERERLSKRHQKTPKSSQKHESASVIYSIDTIEQGIDDDLCSAYGGTTPTAKGSVAKKRQHTTPDNAPLKRLTGSTRSPVAPFSPASFSPASATPSKKYNSRSNKGEVVCGFGKTETVNWQGQGQPCMISPYDTDRALSRQFKYMFQKLSEKFRVLDDIIEDMAEQLKKAHSIEDFSHVALPTQEQVTVVGRVCCDSQGRLNSKSVMLEGSVDMSSGKCIPVDVSQMKEYALFPGQVVALDGNNSTGQKFVPTNLYESVCLPFPEIKVKSEPGVTRLSVMIVAGPYSTSDSLSYEPLRDFVNCIQQTKPDVCIMMGPFVDEKNKDIEDGKLSCTFEELFRIHMENIATVTERVKCEVIVLPSYRDVHHDLVYPQPPFKIDSNFNYKHVHFMSDPCTVNINNIVFGLTSTDVIFQMGMEEISFPPGSSDRLGRLTQHLITQQSYYPLYPASDTSMCIDYEQFENYARMPCTPHILVVPSEFKQFVKDLKGCCCVNPGRLTKGQAGGTYTKMVVQVNNLTNNQSIIQNITAQVVRI